MEILPPEMVEAVADWVGFRDRVRLSGVCRHLRLHAFRKAPIDLPLAEEKDCLDIEESFPSFFAALETAVDGGAYFRSVSFTDFLGERRLRDDGDALMGLVMESEAEEPKLRLLELDLASDSLLDMSHFSALRGLRLGGYQPDVDMGPGFDALADLPALQSLEIDHRFHNPTLVQLNKIPIQRLSDLRLEMQLEDLGPTQTWLDTLPVLPQLRSLRVADPVHEPHALRMDWGKVPALRWLQGYFKHDDLNQLSHLERWYDIGDKGMLIDELPSLAKELVSVMGNPGRPAGVPLYLHTHNAERRMLHMGIIMCQGGTMGDIRWYKDGDKIPKGFHCPRTGRIAH